MSANSGLSLTENEFQSNDSQNTWNVIFQRLKNEATVIAKDCSTQIARSPLNRSRNRYRDVSPYDHSRICLTGLPDNDYINASLIRVPEANNRRYILTQGPLSTTSGHFWLMVWQENCPVIVMLNKLVEKHVPKCHPYFPHGELHSDTNDNLFPDVGLKVTFVSENHYGFYIQRVFHLQNIQTEETRSVLHFHYLAWPDFGVPQSPGVFLNFLWSVRQAAGIDSFQESRTHTGESYSADSPDVEGEEIDFSNSPPILTPAPIQRRNEFGPPLIHCSAGIGRSGTFALVDSALIIVEKYRSLHQLNLTQLILEMRQDRMGLIQSPDQLRFCYQAVIEAAHTLLNSPPEDLDSLVFPMDSSAQYKESDTSSETSSGESDVEEILFESDDDSDMVEEDSPEEGGEQDWEMRNTNARDSDDEMQIGSGDKDMEEEDHIHRRLLPQEYSISPADVQLSNMSNINTDDPGNPSDSTLGHANLQSPSHISSDNRSPSREEKKQRTEARIKEIKNGMERSKWTHDVTRLAVTGGCIAVVVAGAAIIIYRFFS